VIHRRPHFNARLYPRPPGLDRTSLACQLLRVVHRIPATTCGDDEVLFLSSTTEIDWKSMWTGMPSQGSPDCSQVSEPIQTLPILANVSSRAMATRCGLTATDLYVGARSPCRPGAGGRIHHGCPPALLEIVKELPAAGLLAEVQACPWVLFAVAARPTRSWGWALADFPAVSWVKRRRGSPSRHAPPDILAQTTFASPTRSAMRLNGVLFPCQSG